MTDEDAVCYILLCVHVIISWFVLFGKQYTIILRNSLSYSLTFLTDPLPQIPTKYISITVSHIENSKNDKGYITKQHVDILTRCSK